MSPEVERLVLERVGNGEPACFPHPSPGSPKPAISAALLRRLLLGLHDGCGMPYRVALPGVRIRGARIDGMLDLSDCARPGVGLPTLALENCDIPQKINLEGARISSLSIKNSRFSFVNAREAEIDGPFDFSSASPHPTSDGSREIAWIDARSSIINGQLTGNGAQLRAPKPENQPVRGNRRAALWLENADIRGSVTLLKDGDQPFVAQGGINLIAALVRGDIWANDAELMAGEADPLLLQGIRVGGAVVGERIKVDGMIWMVGAHIGNGLQLRNARIVGYARPGIETLERNGSPEDKAAAELGLPLTDQPACDGGKLPSKYRIAINARNLEVSARVMLNGASCKGRVTLTSAIIRGDLNCIDAKFENRTSAGDAVAFEAINSEVMRNVNFDKGRIAGVGDLTGAKIAGDLTFEGAELVNQTSDGQGHALVAQRTRVDGSVRFYGGFQAFGQIDFSGASVGQDFEVGWEANRTGFAYPSENDGCADATIFNPRSSAVYAKDLTVGDDLRFYRADIQGDLRFERGEVGGSVVWDESCLGGYRGHEERPPFDLRHARIGTALKARKVSYHRDPLLPITRIFASVIDLRGMQVATIEYRWPDGWGGVEANDPDAGLALKLDGCTYERLDPDRGPASSDPNCAFRHKLRRRAGLPKHWPWRIPRHELADPLLDCLLRDPAILNRDWRAADSTWKWLRRFVLSRILRARSESPPRDIPFFPQPFRQLARVLRAQGEEEAARRIAVAEQWAIPKRRWGAAWLWQQVFGRGFGFGLRWGLATTTLAVWLAIGVLWVWFAAQQQMFVQNTVVATSSVVPLPEGGVERVLIPASPTYMQLELQRSHGRIIKQPLPIRHAVCTETANNPFADAVFALDMIVPFIPLHQETKCDIEPAERAFSWAAFWTVFRAFYCVVGWVIVSLWLLTLSGIVKRFESEPG